MGNIDSAPSGAESSPSNVADNEPFKIHRNVEMLNVLKIDLHPSGLVGSRHRTQQQTIHPASEQFNVKTPQEGYSRIIL